MRATTTTPTGPDRRTRRAHRARTRGPRHAHPNWTDHGGPLGTESVGLEYQGSGTTYFSLDTQRSVLQTSADPTSPTTYDPYGTPSLPAPIEWAYRTQLQYGYLLHLRNRDLDTSTGTFTTPDPLDGQAATTTETNPYHYVDNDPVNRTDLLGLSPDGCSSSVPIIGGLLHDICEHHKGINQALGAVATTAAALACGTVASIGGPATSGAAAGMCGGMVHRAIDAYTHGEDPWAAALNNQAIARDAIIGAAIGAGADWGLGVLGIGTETTASTIGTEIEGTATSAAEDTALAANSEGELGALEGATCSFDPDTQVVMADGTTKPIRDVHIGDKVEAGDPSTGQDEGGRAVTALHDHRDDDLVDVTVTGRDGRPHTIHTMARHPFWDDTTKTWIAAGGLTVGHDLRTVDGHDIPIAAVTDRAGESEMLNLTVDGLHTFYVRSGTEAVLVHNVCLPKPEDVGVQGSSSNIRVLTGGRDAAEGFFNRFATGGVDVTPAGYGGAGGGQLVQLPDGSYVGIRYVSPYGDPAVDFNGADGLWRVHFGS